MEVLIKYFENATKVKKIEKGNWIDLYSNDRVFIPVNEMRLVPLGVAMQLPEGYEAHLAPRSSTFKTWGCIQTNHVGVIDSSYCGDNDMWRAPLYCLEGKSLKYTQDDINEIFKNYGVEKEDIFCGELLDGSIEYKAVLETGNTFYFNNPKGVYIEIGDKICQFRIIESMHSIDFKEVEVLENKDRNGFGSTGTK